MPRDDRPRDDLPRPEIEQRLRTALADAVADVDPPGPGPAALRAAATGTRPAPRLRRVLLPALAAAAVVVAAGITVAVRGVGGQPEQNEQPAATQRATAPATVAPTGTGHARPTGLPPACTAAHLDLSYHGDNHSSRGADSATIGIVNTADTTCRLDGAITVEPLDADGRVIPTVPGWSNTVTAKGLPLGGNGAQPAPGSGQLHVSTAKIGLANQQGNRHGSAPGCPKADVVTPVAWRLSGAVTGTVPNVDRAVLPTEALVGRRLFGCDRGDGLDLAKVVLLYPPPAHPLPTSTGRSYTGSTYHASTPPTQGAVVPERVTPPTGR